MMSYNINNNDNHNNNNNNTNYNNIVNYNMERNNIVTKHSDYYNKNRILLYDARQKLKQRQRQQQSKRIYYDHNEIQDWYNHFRLQKRISHHHRCSSRTNTCCYCPIVYIIIFILIGVCNIYYDKDDTFIGMKNTVNAISFSSSCINNYYDKPKQRIQNANIDCVTSTTTSNDCNNIIESIITSRWRGGSNINIDNIVIPKQKRNKSFSLSNRFMFGKPTITITVRDPYQEQQSSSSLLSSFTNDNDDSNTIMLNQNNINNEYDNNNNDSNTYSSSQRKGVSSSSSIPFLDISSIHPTIQWNIFESKILPLPNWFPSFKSLKGSIGYDQYHNHNQNDNDITRQSNDNKNSNIKQQFAMYLRTWKNQIQNLLLPSWYESTMQFALPGYEKYGHTLLIQPTYYTNNNNNNHINILIQLSRGVSYIQTNFSNRSLKNNHNMIVETIKGYLHYGNLPFVTLSSITIIPIINFISKEITCQFEMTTTGTSSTKRNSNTRAVMNLEYNNPTLTIYYSPNEYNLISPTISLYTANIMYQWKVLLRNHNVRIVDDVADNHNDICGSFTMKVDPLSHIQCTWIDETKLDYGGHWITDITIPFTSTTSNTDVSKSSSLSTPNSLLGNASVRIRRKFQF